MDLFYIEVLIGFIIVVLLMNGLKGLFKKFGKKICIRCYVKFKQRDVIRHPAMRAEFYCCIPCGEIVKDCMDKQ